MAPVKLKIKCRIEEVPTLGAFLINSMTPLTDFTSFSPDYNAGFITTANAELASLEALINPKQITSELKIITQRIYSNQILLLGKIDLLEGYINRATGLTIDKKDFGISVVRTKNNKGDIEGLVTAITFLLTNVANNLAPIQAKGYTPAQNTAITQIKTDLKADNIAQNAKINERNNKVIANYTQINRFWDKLTDIADAGKRIYKSTAPNRLDDFTITKLKKRINQERNNTLFEGTITSDATPLSKAKIILKPILGGRKRTTISKADGTYSIASIEQGDYIVTIIATGKTPQTDTITIITNTPLTKNYDLV